MDETTKTNPGIPQPVVAGLSPEGEGGITPPAGKTYTEADFQKAISDLKAGFGRKEKELTKSLKEAQAERDSLQKGFDSTSSRLEALEDRVRESDLEVIRNDPAQLRLYQEREADKVRIRDLEKQQRENAATIARATALIEEVRETKKSDLLSVVANKVTPEKLEKLRGLTLDALEVMVDVIGKEAPPITPTSPAPTEFQPDSALSSGGIGGITPEWAEKASMEEYAARRKKQEPTKFPL